jgi:hypothetical protein
MVQFPQEVFSLILSYNKGSCTYKKTKKSKDQLIRDIDWVIGELRGTQVSTNAIKPPYMEDTNNNILFTYRPIFIRINNPSVYYLDSQQFIIDWVDGNFINSYPNGEPDGEPLEMVQAAIEMTRLAFPE